MTETRSGMPVRHLSAVICHLFSRVEGELQPRPGSSLTSVICHLSSDFRLSDCKDQAGRAISTGRLRALLHVHPRPIDVVVYHGPDREAWFRGGFPA